MMIEMMIYLDIMSNRITSRIYCIMMIIIKKHCYIIYLQSIYSQNRDFEVYITVFFNESYSADHGILDFPKAVTLREINIFR